MTEVSSSCELLLSPGENNDSTQNRTQEQETQPISISESMEESVATAVQSPPWGLLFGFAHDFPRTQLTSNEYIVGRNDGPPVHIVLPRPPDSESARLKTWLAYSRIQFHITKENGVVSIEDRSSNGTFVNGKRLVKGLKVNLENNSEIALAEPQNKVMVFVDLSILDDPGMPTAIREQYRFCKRLGQGACGEVHLAFSCRTGAPVALKVVHRSRFLSEAPKTREDKHSGYAQALREAKVMRDLSHPCIIRILDVLEDELHDDIFLALEYVPGGELFDRITEKGKLKEDCAKFMFCQLALAVQYLHSKGITHRDLKPENILLSSEEDFPIVKLADFGLSKVDTGTVLKTYCGTASYLAPEILKTRGNGSYSKKVDIWSLGVILFAMLGGYPPFYEHDGKSLEENILAASFSFPTHHWLLVSPKAIGFIRSLLTLNPALRPSADKMVSNDWMAKDGEMLRKVDEVVFTGEGIKYHWTEKPAVPKRKALPGPSAGGAGRTSKRPPSKIPTLEKVEDAATSKGAIRRVVALLNGNHPPAGNKRGTAGENGRRAQDHLSSAKTPKRRCK